MITAELKDRILKSLVETGNRLTTNIHTDAADYDTDPDTYSLILDQFERQGYLSQSKCMGGEALLFLNAEAHDMVRLGGFVAQEEMLKANIQKLGLEIDLLCKELTPDLLDKAQKISAIGGSILAALKLMS